MNSRKLRKVKKHTGRKIFTVLFSIVLVLGLISFGAVMVGRHLIASKTEAIVAKVLPDVEQLSSAADQVQLPTATPDAIAAKLNQGSDAIASQSQGLIDSAKATSDGSAVTYSLKSSKLSSTAVNALMMTNGDQAQKIADKVLTSMQKSGIAHPELHLNLTDANGNPVKTITYSK